MTVTQPAAPPTTVPQPTQAPSSKTAAPPSQVAPPTGSGALVTAGDTALAKVSGGTVISIDAERNNTAWEVEIATNDGEEHKVYVSWDGKSIQSGPTAKHEDAEDKAENKHLVDGADLDYKRAAKHISDARKGTITELNLDTERGTVVWEADVHSGGTKYEVTIDASSGKVLKNTPDH